MRYGSINKVFVYPNCSLKIICFVCSKKNGFFNYFLPSVCASKKVDVSSFRLEFHSLLIEDILFYDRSEQNQKKIVWDDATTKLQPIS